MKKTFLTAVMFGLSSAVFAADTYTIDATHTFPSFEINHLGFSTQRGRFNSTKGKVTLDIANKKGSVEVIIDAKSIDTGFEKLEEHLRGEDFFNVEKFPTLTFKSTNIGFKDDKPAFIEGNLTLLATTKPVTLTVNYFNCGTNPINKKFECGIDASTSIKRSEFGMATYVPAVGDEVKITIQAEAIKD
ncbi:YceI family protein [Beggiatoa leptomitoformis]|uniref:Polyisoprenoid-binding protein n=1 Tax=Beggiatoa leptomitoformis TaxID=288004 RepID=A0A2N9YI86_9GAMM|nr:YceI family protein [Beggiatoa leptomitoformis]ALG67645.1 polyisoprenoid-binding protein [Beggiatoa leptomitoformis]AUI70119.1 polyisoprenoid-binding protein [Beggiatoa leptomitoformis]